MLKEIKTNQHGIMVNTLDIMYDTIAPAGQCVEPALQQSLRSESDAS
jgi:hypothetical protein